MRGRWEGGGIHEREDVEGGRWKVEEGRGGEVRAEERRGGRGRGGEGRGGEGRGEEVRAEERRGGEWRGDPCLFQAYLPLIFIFAVLSPFLSLSPSTYMASRTEYRPFNSTPS
jgi:hypothetical protein